MIDNMDWNRFVDIALQSLPDFSLSRRSSWELRCSGLLRCA